MKTWLSITLLTTVEKDTRVKLLCQWIQIAECLKSNMGNMFGFAAIMDGLGSKQVGLHTGCCQRMSNMMGSTLYGTLFCCDDPLLSFFSPEKSRICLKHFD